jgi:proteasome accessory factor B
MQSVVERLINLLIFLLDSTTPVTAEDVRFTVAGYGEQSDDAFHRMFERDKEVLRRLGVPLKMLPMDAFEVEHGYTVEPEEYAIADPELTEEERMALSLAARMVRLGGGNAGADGLIKLGGVQRGAGLEPLGADLGPESENLGELFRAVTELRRVGFDYHGEKRSLDPYGLAHSRGHWYLAGGTTGGERVFRVDRISRLVVEERAGSFQVPKGFDIRTVLSSKPWDVGSEPMLLAEVRFDPEVAWWAARTLGIHFADDGHLEAGIPITNRDAFIGWVLSFGPSAEVLSPPELRDEIRARIESALAGVE